MPIVDGYRKEIVHSAGLFGLSWKVIFLLTVMIRRFLRWEGRVLWEIWWYCVPAVTNKSAAVSGCQCPVHILGLKTWPENNGIRVLRMPFSWTALPRLPLASLPGFLCFLNYSCPIKVQLYVIDVYVKAPTHIGVYVYSNTWCHENKPSLSMAGVS